MNLLGRIGAIAAVTVAGISAAGAETLLERGTYLMNGIVACGNCHTPQGPDGPIADKTLAGGLVVEDGPPYTAISANITPDRDTGIGRWTDAQIAIRTVGAVINAKGAY